MSHMELLRNLSIRWKVIHMIMFTMTVALLIACAAFMAYRLRRIP